MQNQKSGKQPLSDAVLSAAQEIAERSGFVIGLYLSGSRADDSADPDRYSDYDLILVVDRRGQYPELAQAFKTRFAPLVILQEPDEPGGIRYGYLMQFERVRIDVSVVVREGLLDWLQSEYAVKKIWERPGTHLPEGRQPKEQIPTQADFSACCNEFWWVAPYVAKGIAREDLVYAGRHIEACLKEELLQMMRWWKPESGKFAHRIGSLVDKAFFECFQKTYDLSDLAHCRDALICLCHLFSEIGPETAERYGLFYDAGEESRVRDWMGQTYQIPEIRYKRKISGYI